MKWEAKRVLTLGVKVASTCPCNVWAFRRVQTQTDIQMDENTTFMSVKLVYRITTCVQTKKATKTDVAITLTN